MVTHDCRIVPRRQSWTCRRSRRPPASILINGGIGARGNQVDTVGDVARLGEAGRNATDEST